MLKHRIRPRARLFIAALALAALTVSLTAPTGMAHSSFTGTPAGGDYSISISFPAELGHDGYMNAKDWVAYHSLFGDTAIPIQAIPGTALCSFNGGAAYNISTVWFYMSSDGGLTWTMFQQAGFGSTTAQAQLKQTPDGVPYQYKAVLTYLPGFDTSGGCPGGTILATSNTISLTSDTTAPVTTLLDAPTGSVSTPTLALHLQATDATSGVDHTNYCVAADPYASACGPDDQVQVGSTITIPMPESLGSHSYTVFYYSTDKAANVEPTQQTTVQVVWTKPPVKKPPVKKPPVKKPPKKPGLEGTSGPAPQNGCRPNLSVGVIKLTGCWKQQTPGIWSATGKVGLDGLPLDSDSAGQLIANTRAKTLSAHGNLSASFGGVTATVHSGETWKPTDTLTLSTRGSLKGLPVQASASATFSKAKHGSVILTVSAQAHIPHFDGTLSGEVKVAASTANGIDLTRLHLKADDLLIRGGLSLKSFELDYARVGGHDRWQGDAFLQAPMMGIDGNATFIDGDLKAASASVTGNLPILDGLATLTGGSISVTFTPLGLGGSVSMALGPKVAGYTALSGTLTLAWTSPSDWLISGQMALLDKLLQQADGHVGLDGNVSFDMDKQGLSAAVSAKLDASVHGYPLVGYQLTGFLTKNAFNLDVKGEVSLGALHGQGEILVSNVGMAACIETQLRVNALVGTFNVGVNVGIGHDWDGGWKGMWHGCSTDDWRVQPSSFKLGMNSLFAAPFSPLFSSATMLNVPAGVPYEAFIVSADAGVPDAVLTSPTGQTIDTRGLVVTDTPDLFVWHNPVENAVLVLVPDPQAGSWSVAAAPGSLPLANVETAEGLLPPTVKATVSGVGAKRTLTYAVSGASGGQSVSFWESSSATQLGATPIGAAVTSSGEHIFTPSPLGPNRRYVWATLNENGLPSQSVMVTSFTVTPQPLPGKPTLRLHVAKQRVQVTWKPTSFAQRYLVHVRVSDGRNFAQLLPANRRTVTVRAAGGVRVQITVRARDAFGRLGATATSKARAGR
jgi:hypothetical protein